MTVSTQGGSLLRWLAVLPLACLIAGINWVLMTVLFGIHPGTSSIAELAFFPAAISGGGFVYIGSVIAPHHREETAYALGFIGLLSLGLCRYWLIMRHLDGYVAWSIIGAALGIIVVMFAIYKKQVEI